jgi:hypothetical protein
MGMKRMTTFDLKAENRRYLNYLKLIKEENDPPAPSMADEINRMIKENSDNDREYQIFINKQIKETI